MKRIVWYIIYGSAEDNDNGIFHYSPAFATEKEARKFGKQREDEWVVLEKHWEKYERYDWRPDWDRGETSVIVEYL